MNKEIIQFLKELSVNNNREWFQANKDRFDVLHKGFIDEVQEVINRIALVRSAGSRPGIEGLPVSHLPRSAFLAGQDTL